MSTPIPVGAAWLKDGRNRILLCRRKETKARGGLWEFPGGKLEAGETPRQAVIRELEEELGLTVEGGGELARTIYAYPEIAIELILVEAFEPRGPITLTDHTEYLWCSRKEIEGLDLAPADRVLLGLLKQGSGQGN